MSSWIRGRVVRWGACGALMVLAGSAVGAAVLALHRARGALQTVFDRSGWGGAAVGEAVDVSQVAAVAFVTALGAFTLASLWAIWKKDRSTVVFGVSMAGLALTVCALLAGSLRDLPFTVSSVEMGLHLGEEMKIQDTAVAIASGLVGAPLNINGRWDGGERDGRRVSVFGTTYEDLADAVRVAVPSGRGCRVALEALVRVETMTERRVRATLEGVPVLLLPASTVQERSVGPREHVACAQVDGREWATLEVSLGDASS